MTPSSNNKINDNTFIRYCSTIILAGLMLFVIFLPFGYSTAAMYIGLLISLLGWIAKLIYQRRGQGGGVLGCRYLDIPIFILLGLGIISTALSPEFIVSLQRFWKIVQGIILFYLVVNNLPHVCTLDSSQRNSKFRVLCALDESSQASKVSVDEHALCVGLTKHSIRNRINEHNAQTDEHKAQSRKNIIQLVVVMLGVAGAISIYGIICYLTKSRLTYDNRLLATFKYPNDFAMYLTIMMPLCMGFFIVCALYSSQQNSKSRVDDDKAQSTALKQKRYNGTLAILPPHLILLGIGLCAMGGSLIFTLTRGAWIAVAIAIIYLIIVFDKRLIFILVVLLAFSPFVMPKHIKSRFMTIIQAIHEVNPPYPPLPKGETERSEHKQGFLGERPYMWRAALEMIKEHPLKGIGPGRFKTEYMLRKPESLLANPDHCHNIYLQIALEMGIPALLAFLCIVSLIFVMILRLWKRVRKMKGHESLWDTGFIIGMSASIIAYLIHGLTDNVLQRRALLMFWFIAGLLCAYQTVIERSTSQSR